MAPPARQARIVTAVGAVLTAVPSFYICRFRVVQATPLIGPPMSRVPLVTEFEVSRKVFCAAFQFALGCLQSPSRSLCPTFQRQSASIAFFRAGSISRRTHPAGSGDEAAFPFVRKCRSIPMVVHCHQDLVELMLPRINPEAADRPFGPSDAGPSDAEAADRPFGPSKADKTRPAQPLRGVRLPSIILPSIRIPVALPCLVVIVGSVDQTVSRVRLL